MQRASFHLTHALVHMVNQVATMRGSFDPWKGPYGLTMSTPLSQFSVGEIHEALASTRADQECLVFRDRHLTWADVTDRTRRFANFLRAQDLGCHQERSSLAPSESGQDHLAIYLHNGNEYLEACWDPSRAESLHSMSTIDTWPRS